MVQLELKLIKNLLIKKQTKWIFLQRKKSRTFRYVVKDYLIFSEMSLTSDFFHELRRTIYQLLSKIA